MEFFESKSCVLKDLTILTCDISHALQLIFRLFMSNLFEAENLLSNHIIEFKSLEILRKLKGERDRSMI